MNVKWRVQPMPTGRYRSFERRGWPELLYEGGALATSIECEDDYTPNRARSGTHAPLHVFLYDYSGGSQNRKRLRMKQTFTSLAMAKKAVEHLLLKHPEWWPKCAS